MGGATAVEKEGTKEGGAREMRVCAADGVEGGADCARSPKTGKCLFCGRVVTTDLDDNLNAVEAAAKVSPIHVTSHGSYWKVDVAGERIGLRRDTIYNYRKVDGRWRSFDGTGYGLGVRVGMRIKLDTILATARRATA